MLLPIGDATPKLGYSRQVPFELRIIIARIYSSIGVSKCFRAFKEIKNTTYNLHNCILVGNFFALKCNNLLQESRILSSFSYLFLGGGVQNEVLFLFKIIFRLNVCKCRCIEARGGRSRRHEIFKTCPRPRQFLQLARPSRKITIKWSM